MDYPPGKAPLAILIMAVVSGALLLLFPPKIEHGNLQIWTFADAHYRAYQSVLPDFQAKHPETHIDLQLVHERAVTSRLRSAFASDLPVPDMVEVEIKWAGSFFIGPLEDIGFVDLTDELKKPRPDGPPWIDRIVKSRFAPYTARRVTDGVASDHIFGLPHDVHPVLLAYRKDIFDAHGIDAEKLTTWDDFLREGRGLLKKMNANSKAGEMRHYLLNLNSSTSDELELLLFQNDGQIFSPDGAVRMDDETAVQMMLWYVPLVAGPDPIGYSLGTAMDFELVNNAQKDELLLCTLMPDWLSGYYQKYVDNASGKMALMPLPAFKPGGRRTSTRGGTMIGFTKKSRQFDVAWQLGLKLYFDPDLRVKQFREFNILPPLREAWKRPELNEANAYWSGQPLGKMYADQADNAPPQYSSPYVGLARAKLGEALSDCVRYYNSSGAAGFEDFVRKRLKQSADEVRLQERLNPYR